MSQNEPKGTIKPSDLDVGPELAKLPRLTITKRAAPSKKAAMAPGVAYSVTSIRKATEAFAVKGVRKD
jgi:hypothetical protein